MAYIDTMAKNAVVMGFSKEFSFAIACVILDMEKVSGSTVNEYVLFHDGINRKDARLLEALGNVRLIKYKFPLNSRTVLSAKCVKQFTKMVFSKLECFKLLNEFDNVMWLDFDIIVQKDFTHLFEQCSCGIMAPNPGYTVRDQLNQAIDDFDMKRTGFFGGTFVLRRCIGDYNKFYEYSLSALEKYAHFLVTAEQPIFDFVIQNFDLDVHWLEFDDYAAHPLAENYNHDAYILHATGQPKFWNGLENPHWNKNYQMWLDSGGKPFTPASKLLELKKKIVYKFWGLWSAFTVKSK
jgi:lipopolysaccharide biosynthesis glycosyltransferase